MGLASLFLQYEGSAGVTATSRLFGDLLTPLTLFAVPLLWTWAKSRSVRVKQTLLSLGFVTIFGGMILFGIELTAAQKPVLPLAMQPMDVQIYNEYWDKLEPDALVFDTLPARAVTIFGRFTDSNETWYVPKAIVDSPRAESLPPRSARRWLRLFLLQPDQLGKFLPRSAIRPRRSLRQTGRPGGWHPQ